MGWSHVEIREKLQNGNQTQKAQEDVPDKDRRIEWIMSLELRAELNWLRKEISEGKWLLQQCAKNGLYNTIDKLIYNMAPIIND